METLEERYFELFKMFNRIVEKMDFVSVSKAEFFLLVQIHRQVQVQEVSTVRTLAQDMGVSSPAVSRMIRSLSEKNMVEKKRFVQRPEKYKYYTDRKRNRDTERKFRPDPAGPGPGNGFTGRDVCYGICREMFAVFRSPDTGYGADGERRMRY